MFEQLLVQFGDVEQFLQEAEAAKLAPQIVPQIRETLSDQAEPNQPPVTTSSHCWRWLPFCYRHLLFRRRWATGILMLWETPSCCWSMSCAPLPKCSRCFSCDCNRRFYTECRYTGTEGKSMRWSSNSVVFAKVQCPVVWSGRSIQGCRDHVLRGSAVDATYGSHRVGSPNLPLLEQRQDHGWFDCRAARLCRCRRGRGGNHWRGESEVVVPTCGASSTLVSRSEAGSIGAAFLCCSWASLLPTLSGI